MPVFGKTLFETVLDGLETDEEDAGEEQSVRRMPDLGAAFLRATSDAAGPDHGDFADLYSDFSEGLPIVRQDFSPQPPVWLDRLSGVEIEEDLALSSCKTEPDLRERRRTFARANHPDMVHPDFRGPATTRMTIANRLIDDAISKLSRQG